MTKKVFPTDMVDIWTPADDDVLLISDNSETNKDVKKMSVSNLKWSINIWSLWDVDDTGITDGQVLAWNNTASEYQPADNNDNKVKNSSNDTTADYLGTKISGGDNVTLTETNDGGDENILISVTTQTDANNALTSITIDSAFAWKRIRTTSGTAVTITLPDDSDIPTDSYIEIFQAGAGQVTFAAGSGVTINSKDSNLKLAGQYSEAVVYKVSDTEYDLVGDLAA